MAPCPPIVARKAEYIKVDLDDGEEDAVLDAEWTNKVWFM